MHSPKQEKSKFATDINWSHSEYEKSEKGYEITELEYHNRPKALNYALVADLDEPKPSADKGGYGEERQVGPYGEEKIVGPYGEEKEVSAYGGESLEPNRSVTSVKTIKGRNWNAEVQLLFEKREKDKTIRDKLETRAKFGQIAKVRLSLNLKNHVPFICCITKHALQSCVIIRRNSQKSHKRTERLS